jgi:hypothetical protein
MAAGDHAGRPVAGTMPLVYQGRVWRVWKLHVFTFVLRKRSHHVRNQQRGHERPDSARPDRLGTNERQDFNGPRTYYAERFVFRRIRQYCMGCGGADYTTDGDDAYLY